jgi:hypothetical protein
MRKKEDTEMEANVRKKESETEIIKIGKKKL